LVRALMLALQATAVTAPVCNVCTGYSVSVIELARELLMRRGRKPAMSYCAPRPGDVRHSLGNAIRAAAVLGFRAGVPLAVGLETTLRHLERQEPALV
jgi:UDP-glucose 4-epimerase